MQMVTLIQKAKKLVKRGMLPPDDFKEIKVSEPLSMSPIGGPCSGVEIVWDNGKLIRFQHVEMLIDFLKKSA